jgi:hypothetical protein
MDLDFDLVPRIYHQIQDHLDFSPLISSWHFITLHFILRSVIHYQLIFLVGFELRASQLLSMHSTTCAMFSVLFTFSYISNSVSCFCLSLTLDHDPPTSASVTIMPGLFVEMAVLITFCLNWSWMSVFLISTSQVVQITGMSHCTFCVNFGGKL